MTTRTELINHLIQVNGYKSYLEIGVQGGVNFRGIIIGDKDGVDPAYNSEANIKEKSDDFFKKNEKNYDLIFIDGLHLQEQVKRDIYNSLKILNSQGLVLVHDCNPIAKKHQRRRVNPTFWNGDVWKAIARIRMNDAGLNICVIDMDQGIGVIKPGSQELFMPKRTFLTWNFLQKNRKKLLNLISIDEFLKSLEYGTK
jgi:hypothetical protein